MHMVCGAGTDLRSARRKRGRRARTKACARTAVAAPAMPAAITGSGLRNIVEAAASSSVLS
jgi:hypothetical protein